MPYALETILKRHICNSVDEQSKYEIVGAIVPSIRTDWGYGFRGRRIVANIEKGQLNAPRGRSATKAARVYARLFDVSRFLFDDQCEYLYQLGAFLRRCEENAAAFRLTGGLSVFAQ